MVKSRSSDELIKNLKEIEAPILFEGLHTTYPLINEHFEDRKVLVRAHNIEHLYYKGLADSENRINKKIFFKTEAKKLFRYEKILHKADKILSISPSENSYFRNQFIDKTVYIPVFHENKKVRKLSKKGEFAMYHGDLRIADNIRSVHFLIDIFKGIKFPLLIASSFINESIINEINKFENIRFITIKNQEHIMGLFDKTHINVLPTFQKTGIKLKLINSLFNGRYCVVTNEMVEDTGLERLCEIGKTKEMFSQKIVELIHKDYDSAKIKEKKKDLKIFDTEVNAKKIIELIN